jgi:hypothetical protein
MAMVGTVSGTVKAAEVLEQEADSAGVMAVVAQGRVLVARVKVPAPHCLMVRLKGLAAQAAVMVDAAETGRQIHIQIRAALRELKAAAEVMVLGKLMAEMEAMPLQMAAPGQPPKVAGAVITWGLPVKATLETAVQPTETVQTPLARMAYNNRPTTPSFYLVFEKGACNGPPPFLCQLLRELASWLRALSVCGIEHPAWRICGVRIIRTRVWRNSKPVSSGLSFPRMIAARSNTVRPDQAIDLGTIVLQQASGRLEINIHNSSPVETTYRLVLLGTFGGRLSSPVEFTGDRYVFENIPPRMYTVNLSPIGGSWSQDPQVPPNIELADEEPRKSVTFTFTPATDAEGD